MFISNHTSHVLRAGMSEALLVLSLAAISQAQAQTHDVYYADKKWTWIKITDAQRFDYSIAKSKCDRLEVAPEFKGQKWSLPTHEQAESFYRTLRSKTAAEKAKLVEQGWKFGEVWLSPNSSNTANFENGTLYWNKLASEEMLVACVTQSKPAALDPQINGLNTYVDNNGLTWLRPDGPKYWGKAFEFCNAEKFDNKNWRLPTVEELRGFFHQVVAFSNNADKFAEHKWKLGYSWSSEAVGNENFDRAQHYIVKLSPTVPGNQPGGSIHYADDIGQQGYAVCVHD